MLLIMKDIRKEQREEQHTISSVNNQRWKINKTMPHQKIPNTIVYNSKMPYQIVNQCQY